MFHHIVDAAGERVDVAWIHRWEHADAQLVASQLAVSVGVYNAVFSQCGNHLGGADAFVKVDGDHGVGTSVLVGDEWGSVIGLFRPLIQTLPPPWRSAVSDFPK